MTRLADVQDDSRYKQYLDKGFVGLINHMGSDESVEFATRMSYGEGTRPVSDTRALLRYLVRHQHTSPIEMGEVVFHLKVPIFIMRQLVRHRTASLNEYSARYSVLTDEFYEPSDERLQGQSKTNKQGSAGALSEDSRARIRESMQRANHWALAGYEDSIENGLSRELARIVMPVGGYTELVWKCDLKNFFNLVKLRTDSHAQAEIQELANTMYSMVKPLFPILCEAFEDYWLNGVSFSRFEIAAIKQLFQEKGVTAADIECTMRGVAGDSLLSQREIKEFQERFIKGDLYG